jgi:hypothetical protein
MTASGHLRISTLYEEMRKLDPEGAYDKLELQLITGEVTAYFRISGPKGEILPIDEECRPINKKAWESWEQRELTKVFRTGASRFDGFRPVPSTSRPKSGTLSSHEWMQNIYVVPKKGSIVAKNPIQPVSKAVNRGGAPTQYDMAVFMICAFELIYFDNSVRSSTELRKRALKLFAERGHGAPEAEWARKPINALWAARAKWNKSP